MINSKDMDIDGRKKLIKETFENIMKYCPSKYTKILDR